MTVLWIIRACSLAFLVLLAQPAWAVVTASCTVDPSYRTGTSLPTPAAVWFDCTATTHSDGTVRPGNDLIYVFEYGDASCSAWSNGVFSTDCNTDIYQNPMGFHAYGTAGSYNWTVTVYDSQGASDVESGTITVHDRNDETHGFSDANTRCVSTSGNFAGCPTGVTDQVTSSDFDAQLQTGDGEATYFRCGETFTMDTNIVAPASETNGHAVGGFGSCGGNPVLINHSQSSVFASPANSYRNWRIADLSFDHTGTGEGAFFSCQASAPFCNRVLLYNVSAIDNGYMIAAGGSLDSNYLAVVGGAYSVTRAGAGGTWPLLASIDHFVIQGIDALMQPAGVDNTANGWRIAGFQKSIFTHNDIRFLQNGGETYKGTIQVRGADDATDQYYMIWAYNRIWDDSDESNRNFAICMGTVCDTVSEDIADTISFEKNLMHWGGTSSRNIAPLRPECTNCSFHNNVFDLRDSAMTGQYEVCQITTNTGGDAPGNVDCFNNTVLGNGSQGSENIRMCNDAVGIATDRCRNNLVYETTKTSGSQDGDFTTESNNVILYGSANCPFYGTDGSCTLSSPGISWDPTEVRLRVSGGGIASVRGTGFDFPDTSPAAWIGSDMEGRGRPANSDGWDVGASEYGATLLTGGADAPLIPPIQFRGVGGGGVRLP